MVKPDIAQFEPIEENPYENTTGTVQFLLNDDSSVMLDTVPDNRFGNHSHNGSRDFHGNYRSLRKKGHDSTESLVEPQTAAFADDDQRRTCSRNEKINADLSQVASSRIGTNRPSSAHHTSQPSQVSHTKKPSIQYGKLENIIVNGGTQGSPEAPPIISEKDHFGYMTLGGGLKQVDQGPSDISLMERQLETEIQALDTLPERKLPDPSKQVGGGLWQ